MAVNQHHRFVKDDLLLDSSSDSFKLINSLLCFSKIKKTLRNSCIHFDVLIGTKAKGFCGHVNVLVFFVLIRKINTLVKQLGDLIVAGQTFFEKPLQQETLTFYWKQVQIETLNLIVAWLGGFRPCGLRDRLDIPQSSRVIFLSHVEAGQEVAGQ